MIYLIYYFGKFRGCERWLAGFSLAHHESEGEKKKKTMKKMRLDEEFNIPVEIL